MVVCTSFQDRQVQSIVPNCAKRYCKKNTHKPHVRQMIAIPAAVYSCQGAESGCGGGKGGSELVGFVTPFCTTEACCQGTGLGDSGGPGGGGGIQSSADTGMLLPGNPGAF